MTAATRTSRFDAAARAVPWSTRAILLLAFAIQLAPVADRLPQTPSRPADRLVLCDGRLVALWLAEGVAKRAAPAQPVPAQRLADGQSLALPSMPDLAPGRGITPVCGILPMPPPAVA